MSTLLYNFLLRFYTIADNYRMNMFWESATKMMDQQGVNQSELARRLDIPRYRVSKWIRDGIYPQADHAVKISAALGTTVENLITGETSVDPAEIYLKKTPGLRPLIIKLGLHPELVGPVDGYLNGYMDSHGYSQEGDKKESQNAG